MVYTIWTGLEANIFVGKWFIRYEPGLQQISSSEIVYTVWTGLEANYLRRQMVYTVWTGLEANYLRGQMAYTVWTGLEANYLRRQMAYTVWTGLEANYLRRQITYTVWTGLEANYLRRQMAYTVWTGLTAKNPQSITRRLGETRLRPTMSSRNPLCLQLRQSPVFLAPGTDRISDWQKWRGKFNCASRRGIEQR